MVAFNVMSVLKRVNTVTGLYVQRATKKNIAMIVISVKIDCSECTAKVAEPHRESCLSCEETFLTCDECYTDEEDVLCNQCSNVHCLSCNRWRILKPSDLANRNQMRDGQTDTCSECIGPIIDYIKDSVTEGLKMTGIVDLVLDYLTIVGDSTID